MTARNRSVIGFTLVELLVVIAIITILAGLLLPVLSQAIETARSVACVSVLKQQGVAVSLYADSYDGYGPVLGNNRGTPWKKWSYLDGYASRLGYFLHPEEIEKITGYSQAVLYYKGAGLMFLCPKGKSAGNHPYPFAKAYFGSQWILGYRCGNAGCPYCGSAGNYGWHEANGKQCRPVRLARLSQMSRKVLLREHWDPSQNMPKIYDWSEVLWAPSAPMCHPNGRNYLHGDIHVQSWILQPEDQTGESQKVLYNWPPD